MCVLGVVECLRSGAHLQSPPLSLLPLAPLAAPRGAGLLRWRAVRRLAGGRRRPRHLDAEDGRRLIADRPHGVLQEAWRCAANFQYETAIPRSRVRSGNTKHFCRRPAIIAMNRMSEATHGEV